jgi:hypothetical protein
VESEEKNNSKLVVKIVTQRHTSLAAFSLSFSNPSMSANTILTDKRHFRLLPSLAFYNSTTKLKSLKEIIDMAV